MIKYYHPKYSKYFCDEDGNCYSEKYFDDPRGRQYTLNKEIREKGFWELSYHNLKDGYIGISVERINYRRNRFCYECYHGVVLDTTTKFVVDHINHNRTDDSLNNLRYISQKDNIDNDHRNHIVSMKIRKNRWGKNGNGSIEEYLSVPHTLSHFKRDITKRGYSADDFVREVYDKSTTPIKYMFFLKSRGRCIYEIRRNSKL